LVQTDNHQQRNQTRGNYGGQGREDDPAPFHAHPKTAVTVAAAVDMRVENKQYETFPEFPATSDNVIRVTLWALQFQDGTLRFQLSEWSN